MERKYRQRGYSDRDAAEKKRRPRRPARRAAAAASEAGHAGAAHAAHGRHGDEGALLELRRGARAGLRSERRMSALPGGDAFLQAVRAFRYRQRSLNARSRFRSESRTKLAKNDCTFFEFRMTVEKDTSPVTYATNTPCSARSRTSQRCAQSLRRPLQEVDSRSTQAINSGMRRFYICSTCVHFAFSRYWRGEGKE